MTVKTRDFGAIELDDKAVLEFATPIFGFDKLRRYVVLSDEEMGAGLFWLQALEDEEVCFILLDPLDLGLDYFPEVPADAPKELGQEPVVRVIAVVPQDFKDTTVNLKSPILINPKTQRAAQVILDADYPIRLRVFGGEDGPC